MIGYYNYTVILTYLSLVSASAGIIFSLSDSGHPYVGTVLLLLCGLCDAFDGKVARTKKDRDRTEQNFGIQIDSLSDLMAFGMLPASIGVALYRRSTFLHELGDARSHGFVSALPFFMILAVLILYILAAMIRLAYFNVTEEERQREVEAGTPRKFYTGLPVTSSALIFPTVTLVGYAFHIDVSLIYYGVMLLTGFAFVSNFHVRKPGIKGILALVAIGALEFVAITLFRVYLNHG